MHQATVKNIILDILNENAITIEGPMGVDQVIETDAFNSLADVILKYITKNYIDKSTKEEPISKEWLKWYGFKMGEDEPEQYALVDNEERFYIVVYLNKQKILLIDKKCMGGNFRACGIDNIPLRSIQQIKALYLVLTGSELVPK